MGCLWLLWLSQPKRFPTPALGDKLMLESGPDVEPEPVFHLIFSSLLKLQKF